MVAAKQSHPTALPFLFLTELWERFGFYVVQGLLVLYMTQYFKFSDIESYSILGVFTALAYISPLAGGYLANKLFGFKNSVTTGGILLIFGYFLLSLPWAKVLLYPALAIIIIGNGLFKPNVSSLLGLQYSENDPRRDAGFTIFYIGINIGALLAGFSSGYIKEFFGWRTSFALASIGLIIGVITFLAGGKYIKSNEKALAKLTNSQKAQTVIYILLLIAAFSFLIKVNTLANWLLPSVGVILIVFMIYLIMQQTDIYRQRLTLLTILIFSSVIFWMLFFQLFYSANLFVDRLVDKHFLGIPLTTTVFYALESVFIILLGPLFAWAWQTLGHKNKNPSPILKFIFGIFFAGIGFLVLGISTFYPNTTGLISSYWIFFAYLLITIGELFLSPIGLSAVTMLSPSNLVGLMMGIWFVGTGFGGMFAGWLADISNVPITVTVNTEKLAIYQRAFFDYAYIAFFTAIVLFFVSVILKRAARIAPTDT